MEKIHFASRRQVSGSNCSTIFSMGKMDAVVLQWRKSRASTGNDPWRRPPRSSTIKDVDTKQKETVRRLHVGNFLVVIHRKRMWRHNKCPGYLKVTTRSTPKSNNVSRRGKQSARVRIPQRTLKKLDSLNMFLKLDMNGVHDRISCRQTRIQSVEMIISTLLQYDQKTIVEKKGAALRVGMKGTLWINCNFHFDLIEVSWGSTSLCALGEAFIVYFSSGRVMFSYVAKKIFDWENAVATVSSVSTVL